MRIDFAVCLGVTLMIAAPAALAGTTVPAAVTDAARSQAAGESDDDRTVCRREKTVGSNLTKRVCRSARQMQEEQEAARDTVRRGVREGSGEGRGDF